MLLLLIVAACASSTDATPTAAPPTPTAAISTACVGDGGTPTSAEWADAGEAAAEIVPVIVSSHVTTGPNRLLFTVMDPDLTVLASPEMRTQLRLYALDQNGAEPVLEVEGTFLDTGTGRGLYRAAVEFSCSGMWGAELVVHPQDGDPMQARTLFRVAPASATAAIGAPAPRSDSLTASTMEEVRRISTDPEPDPRAYRLTIEEAVTSGKPSVIFFATPAFCQSGVCGPTVDMVKGVVADYGEEIEFVNIEPYKLQETPNGLQPELDDQGRLQPVPAVSDYGILVEPYLFVVDANGDVASRFEVVVGEDELRGALEDVTLAARSA